MSLEREAEKAEDRKRAHKDMLRTANELRSFDTRMVSTDGVLARICEAIAVLLEEKLP